jgi:hypothetical protein
MRFITAAKPRQLLDFPPFDRLSVEHFFEQVVFFPTDDGGNSIGFPQLTHSLMTRILWPSAEHALEQ